MSNLVPVGALRFNTETSKLEYFDGNQYVNITTDSPEQRTGGTRGLFGGGSTGPGNVTNEIDFINVDSTGTAIDFGDLTEGRSATCVSGNQTRAVAAGGAKTPGTSNVIDYVTIASTGDAVDFGDVDITYSNSTDGGCGNATRGISHQRATDLNGTFFHFNISTTGNATEFSDNINSGNNTLAGGSNAVRGLFQGGYAVNAISAVTISTLGSAFDFGDQAETRYTAGAAASGTRYVSIGGSKITPSYVMTNILEHVQIATTGNTIDFGDLSITGYYITGMSNGHGGLG